MALAEELLQEAVYRSRSSGAESTPAAPFVPPAGSLDAPAARTATAGAGPCGLGAKAAIDLDFTPRAETLFRELFPAALTPAELEALRETIAAWVKRQDAIDRRRNHFLKDFRGVHGLDRRVYARDTLAAFEAGLERINEDALAQRRSAAESLLSLRRR